VKVWTPIARVTCLHFFSWSCVGGGTQIGSAITLGHDEDVTCTINNDDIPQEICPVGDRVTSVTLQVTGLTSSPVSIEPVESKGTIITDVMVITADDLDNATVGTTFRIDPLGGAVNLATQNLRFYVDGDLSKTLKVHLSCSDDSEVGDVYTGDGVELTKTALVTNPKE